MDIELNRELFRDMMLACRLDYEALLQQRQGELNLWLMCWVQEAAQIGSVRALRDSEMIFPSYRDPGESTLWEDRDPVSRLRALLERNGVDERFFAAVDAECDRFGIEVRQILLLCTTSGGATVTPAVIRRR